MSEYDVTCVRCGESEMLAPIAIRSWVIEHDAEHEPDVEVGGRDAV